MSYDPMTALRSRIASVQSEALELAERSSITPAEDKRLDSLLNELDELRGQAAEAEAREARLVSLRSNQTEPILTERTIHAPYVNKRSNPFDTAELRGMDPEKRDAEVRARAVDVIDARTGRFDHITDTDREHTTRLLDEGDNVSRDAAEYILTTGSPEYTKAFADYVRNPQSVSARMRLEEFGAELESRTALTTAGVSGAIHAPYWLDPALIITNAGVVDPMRQVSRQVTISGTDKWVPPFTSGVTAGYITENGSFTDRTPTFTSTSIQTYQAGAWVQASFQSAEDSSLANELGMLFADAKARFEAGEFATGSGSSAMQGIVTFASNATSVVTGSSGAANAATIAAADVYGLRESLSPRWRPNGTWMASMPIAHKIRQLGDSQVGHAFSLDLTQPDETLRLLGRPFYENSSFDTTVVSGSTDDVLVHGDFSQFVIVNRLGVTINYIPVLTSGGTPMATAAWVTHWRAGSGGLVQDAFRLLRV